MDCIKSPMRTCSLVHVSLVNLLVECSRIMRVLLCSEMWEQGVSGGWRGVCVSCFGDSAQSDKLMTRFECDWLASSHKVDRARLKFHENCENSARCVRERLKSCQIDSCEDSCGQDNWRLHAKWGQVMVVWYVCATDWLRCKLNLTRRLQSVFN